MLLGKWSSLLGDRLGSDGSSEHQEGMPGWQQPFATMKRVSRGVRPPEKGQRGK